MGVCGTRIRHRSAETEHLDCANANPVPAEPEK